MHPRRSSAPPRAALFLALFLLPGLASAQLTKEEQKCVNTTNKNAQKLASAQGKDIAACIKDFAKGKETSAEACSVSDPKGKVKKTKGKLDEKTAKDCGDGSGFVGLADNATVKQLAMDQEFEIIHELFGTDLDTSVIKEADDKTNSKCQQAIAKAVFKCQDTKWKEFNACKKNALKAGKEPLSAGAASSQELQDACFGVGTGGIPDGKGKIAKKCDFSGRINKKCPDKDVFPGCGTGNDTASLNACIDQKVECELCLALQVIEGFNRSCDLFDDGTANGSCPDVGLDPLGTHLATQDPFALCEGGDNEGAECTSALPVFPDDPNVNVCTGGGTCVPKASFLITSNQDNAIEIPTLFDAITEVTCGPVDPNDGTAVCTTEFLEIAGQSIPLGFVCVRPRPDLNCEPSLIDCDGGTPMDMDYVQKHDVGLFAQAADPDRFPFSDCRVNPDDENDLSCFGAGSPSCIAKQTCSDMCDLYCTSLGPAYKQVGSGCEGICEGEDPNSSKFGATCTSHAACAEGLSLTLNDARCAGGFGAPHAGQCQCRCRAVGIGPPGRPGAFLVRTGQQTWFESAGPCDQIDITSVSPPSCGSVTSEMSTATALDDGAQLGVNWSDVPLMGKPPDCESILTSVTSSKLVGHGGGFDGPLGDTLRRSTLVNK